MIKWLAKKVAEVLFPLLIKELEKLLDQDLNNDGEIG